MLYAKAGHRANLATYCHVRLHRDPQHHSDITYLVIFASQFPPPAISVVQRWTVNPIEPPYQTKNSDGVVCLTGRRQTCDQGVK